MTYRVTWEGYYDTEAESEEEAKQKFINYIENQELDLFGHDWLDLIRVEEIDTDD